MTDRNDEKPELRPHQFDGIQEYDNQLPKWWLGLFYLSIVFALAYLYWFEFAEFSPNLATSYQRERQIEEMSKREAALKTPELSEEALLALVKDLDVLKKGQIQFQAKCVSCHGAEGEGLVGPNLTDDHYLHGNKMTDMLRVVREGVLAKGMPPWGALMTADEIRQSVAYVKSLHGHPVKNPKKPEGELIK